jgi:serine/threonine-protein kinase
VTCSHCGYEHPDGTVACPKTQERMTLPGLVGTRVDRYQVLKLLGVGGFGAVYRAQHVHTDAIVALKVLKRALNADQAMLDRFLREAKAAASVGSEHIVRVLDAGVANDGTAFLAMELLDGWDLKELLAREGPLDAARLVGLMGQVLDGLAAAHQKGIVHRDMKPANVFVVKQGNADFVKLLDFGISKMKSAGDVHGLTMTGVAMGTPAYMAPEQFFDARNVDGRADLYSVAAMLYELLGGRLPFDAQSYAELIVKVRTETPKPLATLAPQLPAALSAAVDRGLVREKEARWPAAEAFKAALTALGPLPSMPPRATPLPPKVDPLEASLMFGKTATPMPANTGPVPTPLPSAPQPAPGWVAPPTPVPQQPTPQPVAGWVTPPQTLPPAQPPRPLQPQQPQKSNTAKIALIAMGIVGALFFSCCVLGGILNSINHPH